LGFVFNDMGNNVGERVERVTGPGRFTVLRAGFHAEGTYFEGGTCAPFQNPDLPPVCDPTVVTDVYAFDFSGQQTLSVDFVALALHASSTTPAPGEIVHFQAEGSTSPSACRRSGRSGPPVPQTTSPSLPAPITWNATSLRPPMA